MRETPKTLCTIKKNVSVKMCSRKKNNTEPIFLFGHEFMNVYQTKLSCGYCITKKKKDDLVDKLKRKIDYSYYYLGRKKEEERSNKFNKIILF